MRQRPRRRAAIPRCWRCSAASRAASRRRTTTRSSRASACRYPLNDKTVVRASAGVFHNRVTLNDSTLLGGNPPFQPQVDVSNGSVDNPARHRRRRRDLPFGINGAGPGVQAPDRRTCGRPACSARCRSASSSTSPTSAAAASTCSASATSTSCRRARIQANPGVNIAALRPYHGLRRRSACRRTPAGRSTTACRSAPTAATRNGLKVGVAYTLGKSEDNGSDKRDVLWNTYDDTDYWGTSSFDRRHVLNVYYIYDLPFWRDQSTLMKNLLGGWQISGATFLRTRHAVLGRRRQQRHRRRRRRRLRPAVEPGRRPDANATAALHRAGDGNCWFNPAAFAQPAAGTFGNAPRNIIVQPGRAAVGHRALQELQRSAARAQLQFRAEIVQLPEPPEPRAASNAESDERATSAASPARPDRGTSS